MMAALIALALQRLASAMARRTTDHSRRAPAPSPRAHRDEEMWLRIAGIALVLATIVVAWLLNRP